MVREARLDLAVREHVVHREVLQREIEQLILEPAHDRQADAGEPDFQAAHAAAHDWPHPLQTHVHLHKRLFCVTLASLAAVNQHKWEHSCTSLAGFCAALDEMQPI